MTRFARFLLSVSLSLSGVAFAQAHEPAPSEIAVARKLFSDASELEKDKKFPDAEAKLRQAVAIKETPGLRYHLGFCLEQQGKLVEALVEYDRASEMLEHGAKAPDVAELLGPARDGVRKRVARVSVKLPSDVKDAKVEFDGVGVSAAALTQPVPQNPGKHVLGVSAPGRQAFRQELALDESESRDVSVDLPPLAAAAPKSASSEPANTASVTGDSGTTSSSGIPARTLVLIGEAAVTVASLGVGIVFASKRSHDDNLVDQANAELNRNGFKSDSVCGQTPVPTNAQNACSQLPGLVDQRDRHKTIALVGFVGAGVGAAATVATFLLWKPKKSSEAAFHVAPVLTPSTLGVGAVGRF